MSQWHCTTKVLKCHNSTQKVKDLVNMREYAKPRFNILFFDDFPVPKRKYSVRLGKVWKKSKELAHIWEIFQCTSKKDMWGFATGVYIF